MSMVIGFGDANATERSLVGGKAVNLGLLQQRGFPIPPGFSVSTAAYATFLDANGLRARIAEIESGIDYGDADALEAVTVRIRQLILESPIPAELDVAVAGAYAALGDEPYVAVRSSATAEDMEDASFAGLHDTFLDVRGADAVVEHVRMCWASLWTARCASYRERAGIGHGTALIAVVVQLMVRSEVAGVLFTANPFTGLTDEFVVNSSYGLGEGVVSGILTPDEHRVVKGSWRIRERTLGSKEVEIVRNTEGPGTVERDVDAARRERFALTDAQVVELAQIGQTVMASYEGMPQDIEWGYADGRFYLLQARAVTGAEFLWEEDIETWQTAPDDDETIWSHAWAEAYWTGGITPLFYSVRARELRNSDNDLFTLWGFDDLLGMRRFKYRRATAYFSSTADRLYYRYILPPGLRTSSLANLPPAWREEAAKHPFDWVKAARMHWRIRLASKDQGPFRFIDATYALLNHGTKEADGPTIEQLRAMSDEELKAAIAKAIEMARRFLTILRPGFHVYAAATLGAINKMLRDWYTGDNAFAFQELISGLPQRTAMVEESIAVWKVAQKLRASDSLVRLLAETEEPEEFFRRLQDTPGGREFEAYYHEVLLGPHPHRGHADRDLWFPRRHEDPGLDFRTFRTLVAAGDSPSPEEIEHRLIAQREQTTREVVENFRSRPLGALKAKVFLVVLGYVHRFLVLRDDERHYIDRVTMAKKRSLQELGRRLVERGLLEGDEDFYFLSEQELYEVLEGRHSKPLTRAKIENRRKVFDAYNARTEIPPMYLKGNAPIDLDERPDAGADGNTLKGAGIARGTITGRARIVGDLKDIGRLQKGEILICNATDPGWASVFALIGGLVLETGGMLAHGACLSREYGLPAVTLPNAMQRIPDAATITLVGDTGEIRIEEAPAGGAEEADQA